MPNAALNARPKYDGSRKPIEGELGDRAGDPRRIAQRGARAVEAAREHVAHEARADLGEQLVEVTRRDPEPRRDRRGLQRGITEVGLDKRHDRAAVRVAYADIVTGRTVRRRVSARRAD